MLRRNVVQCGGFVTLHVSVWVEMQGVWRINTPHKSRSTWACELKFLEHKFLKGKMCHAPRERVSWNKSSRIAAFSDNGHAPRERVSWNDYFHRLPHLVQVTLHVSVWVEIVFNCDFKLVYYRHAPRERVSWNFCNLVAELFDEVTLHVSVWVEMNVAASV